MLREKIGAKGRVARTDARSTSVARPLALAISLWVALSARAELQWKQERLSLEPPPGAEQAVGIFEFVNSGKAPVRIASVRTDCGCTAMAGADEVVQPGEMGTIRAVFHAAHRKGKQTVAITVAAEEPALREYLLTLEVDVKEFASVTPSVVYWKLGDDPAPRTLHVALARGFDFREAVSATDDFVVTVLTKNDAGVLLQVTPRATWSKRNGTITISVSPGGGRPVEVQALARIL